MENVSQDPAHVQEALWLGARELSRRFTARWGERVMEAERDLFLRCQRHERSPKRRGHRNGYERRRLDCHCGRLWLRTPRVSGTDGTSNWR